MTPEEKEEILNNPMHREEQYYRGILDGDPSEVPEPIHREEVYLQAIAESGGGGGGTTVVANPSGEATDDLSKLKVGNTIYAVEGGSGSLSEPITASVNVGGIKSGDTFAAGTSYDQIFKNLMNPVAYPTLTNPSLSLAGTGDKLLETGATLNIVLTATFNRGSINPAYGTSGKRSGVATGYALNGGTTQLSNTWNETVTANNMEFQATADYEAGEQPKDSTGANYSTPLPAGTATSGKVTYNFVDAMYANTANISTIAKLSLVAKSTGNRQLVFPAQTVANPEVFDIPASWTVSKVEVLNDLSGKWEDCSSEFTVTDTTHEDAAGNTVNYKRYTDNRGYSAGGRTIKVTWS